MNLRLLRQKFHFIKNLKQKVPKVGKEVGSRQKMYLLASWCMYSFFCNEKEDMIHLSFVCKKDNKVIHSRIDSTHNRTKP